MPPIWEPSYRPGFYAHWGHESSVISARTRRAEYPLFTQLLSIKTVCNGTEEYFVDNQRIAVDDDAYLILNAGRRYSSRIESIKPTHSFSIFFRAGLAEEALDAQLRSTESLLSDPEVAHSRSVDFSEQLREHDKSVTPVLRFIRSAVDSGISDPNWLEEQLHFLLGRMLRLEHSRYKSRERVPSAKPATRQELLRRLGLGINYIHSYYHQPIALRHVAAAAHMSPYHLLRTFKAVYGVTPSYYLSRKRTQAAVRLIQSSDWSLTDIAEHVGFGSRTTLFRRLKEHAGVPAGQLRRKE